MHGKVKELEVRIRMIHKEVMTIQAKHTILDDPAPIGALVFTLAEETQTRWFLFLEEHPRLSEGEFFEEWMKIEGRAAANGERRTYRKHIYAT